MKVGEEIEIRGGEMKIKEIEKIFVDLIYQAGETQQFVGSCLEEIRSRFCAVCGEKVLNSPVKFGKVIYHEKCSLKGDDLR